jgi:cGMP-dependent protein kinase
MTVKAEEDMTCLILGRETLSKVLGDQIFVVTFRNFMRWSIEKSTHLSKLSKDQIEKVLDLMKINSYKSGSVVVKKNTENINNQKIIIVIEGALKKYKNINPIAVRSQIYGEEFLLENKTKTRYEDDIVMESDGVIAEIKTDIVKEIIGGYLDTVV